MRRPCFAAGSPPWSSTTPSWRRCWWPGTPCGRRALWSRSSTARFAGSTSAACPRAAWTHSSPTPWRREASVTWCCSASTRRWGSRRARRASCPAWNAPAGRGRLRAPGMRRWTLNARRNGPSWLWARWRPTSCRACAAACSRRLSASASCRRASSRRPTSWSSATTSLLSWAGRASTASSTALISTRGQTPCSWWTTRVAWGAGTAPCSPRRTRTR